MSPKGHKAICGIVISSSVSSVLLNSVPICCRSCWPAHDNIQCQSLNTVICSPLKPVFHKINNNLLRLIPPFYFINKMALHVNIPATKITIWPSGYLISIWTPPLYACPDFPRLINMGLLSIKQALCSSYISTPPHTHKHTLFSTVTHSPNPTSLLTALIPKLPAFCGSWVTNFAAFQTVWLTQSPDQSDSTGSSASSLPKPCLGSALPVACLWSTCKARGMFVRVVVLQRPWQTMVVKRWNEKRHCGNSCDGFCFPCFCRILCLKSSQ